jgi:lysozyme
MDMRAATAAALRLCPGLVLEPEGRRAALADFVFNLGAGRLQASTLRRKVIAGDWDGVAGQLRKWVFGGGRRLRGLVLRREAEVRLL